MTGQISSLPIGLAAVLVAAAMVAGAIDIIRQPGWAWTRAEESKPAYLILDLLLPVIGLAMYAFRARPKVTAAVAAGNISVGAAAPQDPTPPEPEPSEPDRSAVAVPTDRFTGFREMANSDHPGPWETGVAPETPEPFEVSSTFFSTGASSRTMRHPLALARAYRPKQRTSLAEDEPEAVPGPEPVPEPEPERAQVPDPEPQPAPAVGDDVPTVPSGWKTDPTGRHEFRYWDGTHWTENVADDGQESRDAVNA